MKSVKGMKSFVLCLFMRFLFFMVKKSAKFPNSA